MSEKLERVDIEDFEDDYDHEDIEERALFRKVHEGKVRAENMRGMAATQLESAENSLRELQIENRSRIEYNYYSSNPDRTPPIYRSPDPESPKSPIPPSPYVGDFSVGGGSNSSRSVTPTHPLTPVSPGCYYPSPTMSSCSAWDNLSQKSECSRARYAEPPSGKSEKPHPPTRKQCVHEMLGGCPRGEDCPYDHRAHGMGGAGGGKQARHDDETGKDENKHNTNRDKQKKTQKHIQNEFQKHPNERKQRKPIDLTIDDNRINDIIARENRERKGKLTLEDLKIEDLKQEEVVYRSVKGIIHSPNCKNVLDSKSKKSLTKMTVAKATKMVSRLPVLKGGCCRRKLYKLLA